MEKQEWIAHQLKKEKIMMFKILGLKQLFMLIFQEIQKVILDYITTNLKEVYQEQQYFIIPRASQSNAYGIKHSLHRHIWNMKFQLNGAFRQMLNTTEVIYVTSIPHIWEQ